MQHIEDAGIHSGDSACVLPPYLIGESDMQTMREQTVALAKALGVVGLINVQYAIKDGVVYVLEVNPRASRTIPFVSKAIGVPLASLAARVMMGETLDDIGFTEEIIPPYVSVKEAVFPFNKFPGTDPVLGPEMRSTGEVHGNLRFVRQRVRQGAARGVERAAARGRDAHHGQRLRQADGDADRAALPRDGVQAARDARARRSICARAAFRCSAVFKVHEGRPNCLDMIVNGDVAAARSTRRSASTRSRTTTRCARRRSRNRVRTRRRCRRRARRATRSCRCGRGKPRVRSLQEWQQDILDAAAVEA